MWTRSSASTTMAGRGWTSTTLAQQVWCCRLPGVCNWQRGRLCCVCGPLQLTAHQCCHAGPQDGVWWCKAVGDTVQGDDSRNAFNEVVAWMPPGGGGSRFVFTGRGGGANPVGFGARDGHTPPHYPWLVAVDPRGGVLMAVSNLRAQQLARQPGRQSLTALLPLLPGWLHAGHGRAWRVAAAAPGAWRPDSHRIVRFLARAAGLQCARVGFGGSQPGIQVCVQAGGAAAARAGATLAAVPDCRRLATQVWQRRSQHAGPRLGRLGHTRPQPRAAAGLLWRAAQPAQRHGADATAAGM